MHSAPILKRDLIANGKIEHAYGSEMIRYSAPDGRYVYLFSVPFDSATYAVDYEKDQLKNAHHEVLEQSGSPTQAEERVLIRVFPSSEKKQSFILVRRNGSSYSQFSSESLDLVRTLEKQITNEPSPPRYVIPDAWWPNAEDIERAYREAHKPPSDLFKIVHRSDGMDVDGAGLENTVYETSDGTRVMLSYRQFRDTDAANKHLETVEARCAKIIQRETRRDNTGAITGERILCTSRPTAPDIYPNLVLWTGGSDFHEISSSSMEQALRMERFFQ
jgi:hypothetical protein